ncbi:hypothetical protein E1B28_001273 [Marasmius oreades]|uniref:MIT domain-containing protein n=1 Tax=Marasmius oreades TaxID=181124 RepID=A0A9P7V350_9AGAR|nr:uncharacterized protein E1B28_001273 [Marasmius oreades]KAG7099421.1 hypothetical protein E1B28_001273 [Marasmius oreades]
MRMDWDSDEQRKGVVEASSSLSNSSTSYSQRRRSVAAQARPPPPPSLPIPNIPHIDNDNMYNSYHDLSDPPPPSILPTSSRIQDPPQSQQPSQSPPQPHLLAPPDQPAPRPPSSRRALTRALELARQAVQLDSTNDNPELAVQAYGKSVALLSEVMERVRRGEDSTEVGSRKRNGRRRSVVAQEEEVRRLQTIHDTYADRMNILSIIYSIPPLPYSSSSIYSATFNSHELAQAASPLTEDLEPHDTIPNHTPAEDFTDRPYGHDRSDDGHAAIGTAMFLEDLPSSRSEISGLPHQPSAHPYATAQYDQLLPVVPIQAPRQNSSSPSSRFVSSSRRSRALSTALPPAMPPPPNSPPPPPTPMAYESDLVLQNGRHFEPTNRIRGDSVVGHKRTGSGGRLAALEEDEERHYEDHHRHPIQHATRYPINKKPSDATRVSNHESPPLPPVPSPTGESHRTSKPPPSPRPLNQRPRNSSQVSVRSDGSTQMINSSTNLGTISQRRTTAKSSAPPTPRSSSPAESTASAGSLPPVPRSLASSLPGGSTTSVVSSGGRSRSSSQPGRRPSTITSHNSSLEQLPPLPTTNGVTNRKAPYPITSKLNPNAPGVPLTVQTDIAASNGLPSSIGPLTFMATGIPITPTSPLPPAAPADPSRKPYHLMNLLRTTMMSPTGGYITRRLHVPQEVWSQGGAKLGNLIEKVRVVAILCTALEELQAFSSEYFGAGNVSSGMALGIGSIGRREGEAWLSKLEDFSTVCDGVVANFGKKLGVGEGFVVKKTTWGDKLGRRFDKFTNGKKFVIVISLRAFSDHLASLDSPAGYVQGLRKLFSHAQLLDEHTKAVSSQPVAASYSGLPVDIRSAADIKLKRASEFFASVVLTFVIRDLSQLLDKYAKKCEKWLAE